MNAIVTKQTLADMLEGASDLKKAHIIGRALVALFERQTESERNADTTNNLNGRGFASCDARGGSLTAKSYIRNKTLAAWQVARWTRISRGYPRICRYATQLNEIAMEKRQQQLGSRLAQLRTEYGMSVDSDDPKILGPIVAEMRALEEQLGLPPFVIGGAVV